MKKNIFKFTYFIWILIFYSCSEDPELTNPPPPPDIMGNAIYFSPSYLEASSSTDNLSGGPFRSCDIYIIISVMLRAFSERFAWIWACDNSLELPWPWFPYEQVIGKNHVSHARGARKCVSVTI